MMPEPTEVASKPIRSRFIVAISLRAYPGRLHITRLQKGRLAHDFRRRYERASVAISQSASAGQPLYCVGHTTGRSRKADP